LTGYLTDAILRPINFIALDLYTLVAVTFRSPLSGNWKASSTRR